MCARTIPRNVAFMKISGIFLHQSEILIFLAKTQRATFRPGKKWTIAMILQSPENLKRTAEVSEGVYRVWISGKTGATMKERNSFPRGSFASKIFSVQETLAVVIFLSNKQINLVYIYICFPIFTRKFILNENSY